VLTRKNTSREHSFINMSYPPPPGSSAGQSHPSLPARPPPSKSSGFKPAFSGASPSNYQASAAPSYPTTTSYAPGAAPPAQYGSYTSYSSAPGPPGAPAVTTGQYQAQSQPYYYPQSGYQTSGYGSTPSVAAYSAPSRTSHSASGTSGDTDADMAAQYAQWQSAYVARDPSSKDVPATEPAKTGANANADSTAKPEKKKTVVREGGGKKWTDDSLLEWDPSHPRLFVGNLAGEVTDDSLLKAFSRWKSVVKARVVRDKRTHKSKNYGFVSFSDPDDYFQAAKEMNGKYIQSHPVTVTRAKTEIRTTTVKEKDKNKKHNQNKNREGPYEPNLGPIHGSGVQKSQKKKNGLKLLG